MHMGDARRKVFALAKEEWVSVVAVEMPGWGHRGNQPRVSTTPHSPWKCLEFEPHDVQICTTPTTEVFFDLNEKEECWQNTQRPNSFSVFLRICIMRFRPNLRDGKRVVSRRFWHDTEDGLIILEVVQMINGECLARHSGPKLDGGTVTRTVSEAMDYLRESFQQMFPEHRCTDKCQAEGL